MFYGTEDEEGSEVPQIPSLVEAEPPTEPPSGEEVTMEVPQIPSTAEAGPSAQPSVQGAGDEIVIEVPQISSAAGPLAQPSVQAAGDEIAIEVPQIASATGPSAQPSVQAPGDEIATEDLPQIASSVGPSQQPSFQTTGDEIATEMPPASAEDEPPVLPRDEDYRRRCGRRDDVDDAKDAKATLAPEDIPDDQTGLLPEYMIAESIPSLPAVDGEHVSFLLVYQIFHTGHWFSFFLFNLLVY